MFRFLGVFCRYWLCFSLFFFLLPFDLHANHEPEVPSPPTLIDQTHQEISDRLTSTSRWFDDFFSDPRSDEEIADTLIRLRGSTSLIDGEGLQSDGQFKILLNLPNLERRFHLILSSEEDDIHDQPLNDTQTAPENHGTNSNTSLALQYTQERSSSFSLIHRLTATLENSFNPQLRSRVRYSLPIGDQSLLNLTQAVFWEKLDGFGEESRVDLDVPNGDHRLFRATAIGVIAETSQGLEWLTMLQWLRTLNHRQAYSIGAFMVGETRPRNLLTGYNLFFKYRQNFIKKWIFFEVIPEVYWPRERDFKTTGALKLILEIQFGK